MKHHTCPIGNATILSIREAIAGATDGALAASLVSVFPSCSACTLERDGLVQLRDALDQFLGPKPISDRQFTKALRDAGLDRKQGLQLLDDLGLNTSCLLPF